MAMGTIGRLCLTAVAILAGMLKRRVECALMDSANATSAQSVANKSGMGTTAPGAPSRTGFPSTIEQMSLATMSFYKQCKLVKDNIYVQIAWIPEHLAKVGKRVWIADETQPTGRDYGWKVYEVGTRMSEGYVFSHERDHLKTREASDATRDEDGRWKAVGS